MRIDDDDDDDAADEYANAGEDLDDGASDYNDGDGNDDLFGGFQLMPSQRIFNWTQQQRD
jgi:hypothetical protein